MRLIPSMFRSPLERQRETFLLAKRLIDRSYQFADKEAVRDYFTRLTGLFKNLNYSARDSKDYVDFLGRIEELEQEFYTAAPAAE